ncbi:MAG: hypothetical protein AB7O29_00980 [Acidimicrobiia bacterium]
MSTSGAAAYVEGRSGALGERDGGIDGGDVVEASAFLIELPPAVEDASAF